MCSDDEARPAAVLAHEVLDGIGFSRREGVLLERQPVLLVFAQLAICIPPPECSDCKGMCQTLQGLLRAQARGMLARQLLKLGADVGKCSAKRSCRLQPMAECCRQVAVKLWVGCAVTIHRRLGNT